MPHSTFCKTLKGLKKENNIKIIKKIIKENYEKNIF